MKCVIVLDIDETLVYARRKVKGSIEVQSPVGSGPAILRPGTVEFLEDLKSRNFEIISVTQGVVPWQKAVLDALGIGEFFSGIYGWEDLYRTKASRIDLSTSLVVMVDNLSHTELHEKEQWMNITLDPNKNFIRCDEFHGLPNSVGIQHLIPQILLLLNKQIGTLNGK